MKLSEVDISKLTPMMKQYVDIKNEYKDVIIFFRLGDFYEMFFDDAILVSRLLEITLTGKSAGLEERIPMCGVPHHSAQTYVEKLVELGYKVGICEQLEDAKDVKGIVKRGVVQIISKGTIINNESLIEYENNYIGNLVYYNDKYGFSYTDISTGEFYVQLLNKNITNIISVIINTGVKELIVSNNINNNILSTLEHQFKLIITSHETYELNQYSHLYNHFKDFRLIETVKHLISYIDKTQMRNLSHFQKIQLKEENKYLKMDFHTKRNLELIETLRLKERSNSLIWLLDKTKTAMGSRLLKKYIEEPLINIKEINKRYDIVETLTKKFILKNDLQNLLQEVYDLERLSGRIAFGNCNARDLIQLKQSLKVLPEIEMILREINFDVKLNTLSELWELLEGSVYDTPPISIKEGYLIKRGYNSELDELKDLRKGGKEFLAKFEQEEREKTGIKNLKIGYNKVFGYYIEISKANIPLVKDEFGYERKQTLTNCERYISPILKEKEALILNAEEKIIQLEYDLFIELRDKIKEYIPILQNTSKIISKIDVLQSFSTVAEENNYVRPTLTKDKYINILENRHPVVEKVINSEFVPNNIIMDEETNILLITGPNMAGKSTYMRQMAITSIMAQIGSFVPASKAVMPVFDAIFTRIGASDDLVSGESTFMVEMNEANYAISNATSNSLILFDELGRGTATFDGMALAQAIIEHIHDEIKAKTFFSTHYHELTDLEENLKNLKNIHVSAYEEDGNITFLHKIKEGSVDKSYGIHVAKLAKLPNSLIRRASTILKIYEAKEMKKDIKIQQTLPLEELVIAEKSIIEQELEKINPVEITPIEALNILYDLKQKSKNNKDEELIL